MALQLTHDDLLILERQRLERFRSFFQDALPFCWLHLNQGHELKIHCPEPWLVDLLLYDIESLCTQAWNIVGASQVAIYYAQEEIYATSTGMPRSQNSCNAPVSP